MEHAEKKLRYNPSIDEVLRNFQATAVRSLNGPLEPCGVKDAGVFDARVQAKRLDRGQPSMDSDYGFHRGSSLESRSDHSATFTESRGRKRCESPSKRFRQMPLLFPQDSSVTETTETVLEGETIACFAIGGEKRLCVPEVLRKVLHSFELNEIHRVYEELHIFTSLCSQAQLCTLKHQGTLPLSAATCGLITRTYAERLCSTLLRRVGEGSTWAPAAGESVRVKHNCFGKCAGVFFLGLYTSALAHCIRCYECDGLFSPSEFVCHAHHGLENRTCHWGFDSSRWRNYLMLTKEEKQEPRAKQLLDEAKALYDASRVYKRSSSSGRNTENLEEKFTHKKKKVCVEDGDQWKMDSKVESVPFGHDVLRSEEELDRRCEKKKHLENDVKNALDCFHEPNEDLVTDLLEQQSSLWDTEHNLFGLALENEGQGLSPEARQRIIDEYTELGDQHLSLVSKLIQTKKTRENELASFRLKVDGTLASAEAENRAKDEEVHRTARRNNAKLMEASEENRRLRQEVDAIVGGRKRSDIGLMKAKYKAQVEHFRRKLQSTEQANELLIKKRSELHDHLTLCLSTLDDRRLPVSSESASAQPHRIRCRSASISSVPV